MSLRLVTAGESHGEALLAILEGFPAGLALPVGVINEELARRQRGFGSGARMKIEADEIKILGGVMAGKTTGAPLAFILKNSDHKNWRGKAIEPMTAPRPGHADLSGALKYGYTDLRPALERASARETAMRVVAGAACKHYLAQFGIQIGGYVLAIGSARAEVSSSAYKERYKIAEGNDVRSPDVAAAESMRLAIKKAMKEKDTLGGVIEVFALNVPPGLGSFSQWDQRLEARLGAALLSVQAVKGVEIGDAFKNTHLPGTKVQDAIKLGADVALERPTNRAGGIEGGISNGQPIVLRAAMKPIATTLTPQQTVDLKTGEETHTRYERSDFCPVPRAVPILEAMTAFVLADALIQKLGGDSMDEMLPRFKSLRQARLSDLPMDGEPILWWE